ncbi:hypothetical protein [Nonomuraea basaltis]|uniref:hypothetical protein n=1 Tax=Nonomuraea basaltis TaxID=2495887 RepID=UPI00110C431F|nr:hypothetical protein [Nonomuraea basaltis]TMR92632.1 hypothetical protein EJK15_43625 [Nonomuraea basaltis]
MKRSILHNEYSCQGIASGSVGQPEGRYRGRPPALDGDKLEEVRAAFHDEGALIAALARRHGVSRVAIRTALNSLLPDQSIPPARSG